MSYLQQNVKIVDRVFRKQILESLAPGTHFSNEIGEEGKLNVRRYRC